MINIDTVTSIFVFAIGACIGSFLNVVALRGLTGESIVLPPSKCPKCNNKLNWYTNIPIISYCFLRGKCQFCKEHISLQYPIVELTNALLYLFTFISFGYSLKTLFLWALCSLFLVIAITDIKESVVLDLHTYIIIALGLIYSSPWLQLGDINFIQSIIGIAAGFAFFEVIARLGYIFAGTRAFGEGDTLIAMGIGAFFGWKTLLIIIFMSIIIQALFTIPVMIKRALDSKDYKTASALFLVILTVIAVDLFKRFNLYDNVPLILTLLLIVAVILFWCLRVILKDIKSKRETNSYLYLPFGPALVFAAYLMIFFSNNILNYASRLLGGIA